MPSLARIQQALTRLTQQRDALGRAARATSPGARPTPCAISPRHDGGLLGGAELAWDAEHGVPLRAAVYASGDADPVLELKATDISFGPVAAGDLAVPEPAGAKVVDLNPPAAGAGSGPGGTPSHRARRRRRPRSASRSSRPTRSSGLPRQEVRLVELDGTPGRARDLRPGPRRHRRAPEPAGRSRRPSSTAACGGGGLSLPKISINGASGQELDTALGTVLRFDRAGVRLHRRRLGPAGGGRGGRAGALSA